MAEGEAVVELAVGARRVVVRGRPAVIGRDEAADLQVVADRVSRRHLVVTPTAGGWVVEDTSRNGSFVAGRRVTRVPVAGALTIALGDAAGAPEVVVTATAPVLRAAPATPPPTPAPPTPAPPTPAPPTPAPESRTVSSATRRYLEGPGAGSPAARSAEQGRLSAVHRVGVRDVRVGRDPDNDVVLDDLLVSRHHAVLTRSPAGWALTDLGSANGTFVNGRRVTRATIGPLDAVGIGHALLHLDGDRLVERRDEGAVAFSASELVVSVGEKRLLDGVGFHLEERALLAVVGPSGAGKSTLLRALTGFRPADAGRVRYAGRDLYADYDELRERIGLVPQDDILHPQLTVRRALLYAAQLRFPSDVSAAERSRRVDEVVAELGLTGQAGQRISSLSGGQRKRTSVALELLTRPSLLFLDEPTSGLDPGLDKSVMRTLRELADDGRTVVVVTHSVANLGVCDRLLLLAPGGTVAFFGPPSEALRYFGQTDFAEVFLALERASGAEWAARFRASPYWTRHVAPALVGPALVGPALVRPDGRAGPPARPTPPSGPPPAVPVLPPRRRSATAQWLILCRRYLAVIAADRQYVVFMLALPLVLSALSHALPVTRGLSLTAPGRGTPQILLLVLVVGGALMGSAASVRELVKEREIYRRDRAIGLSRAAYLWSKIVVLGVVTGLQGVLLGVLGTLGRPPPDAAVALGSARAEIVLAIVGVSVASMVVGLVLSALIDNADRGMPLLVLVAMLQFILSGAIVQVGSIVGIGQLAWLVPARWAFAMGASSIAIPTGRPGPFEDTDPLWDHVAGAFWGDLAALTAVGVVGVVVTALLLRRLDPRMRPR